MIHLPSFHRTPIGRRHLGLLAAAAIVPTRHAAADTNGPVVAIVRVATPWYAPRMLIRRKMIDTIPVYEKRPGLLFKAFSLEQQSKDFGGIYYWRDRASAAAWFGPAWFERVRTERGTEGHVRFFDAPLSLDNTPGGTPENLDSDTIATLVEIPAPAGLTRERLDAGFRAAVPLYQKVPGLLRKHFIVSDTGTFGGVYLWKDDFSARSWFNDAWHDRVKKTYGNDGSIEWYDVPVLLPTRDPANLPPAGLLTVAAR